MPGGGSDVCRGEQRKARRANARRALGALQQALGARQHETVVGPSAVKGPCGLVETSESKEEILPFSIERVRKSSPLFFAFLRKKAKLVP
jgi:hypothetical protein